MTITELAIKRPTLVVVIFSALGVLGIYGYSLLKYDLFPKMTPPVILITTMYPGGSPSEVENSVTKPIEDAITGLEKITTVRSSSSEGRSFINLEFEQNIDINLALQDAQRKVNQVTDLLPITAKKPVVSKISFDEIPVLRMSVRSSLTETEFFQFVKDRVHPRLSKIAGVGMIAVIGGEQREIRVSIDNQKIKSYGLSLTQVTQLIKTSNIDFPTGNIIEKDNQYVVRVAGKFINLEDLRNLVVGRSRQNGDIFLHDIAEIIDGTVETHNINRLNGIASIGLIVQKTSDANTVDVSKKIRNEIDLMTKDYKDVNLKFDIAQDASDYIMASAHAVQEDLGLAILLVGLVMLVFLHSIRNSLIVLVAIPCSLVSVFLMMYVFDFSLNMMTLLAMSLVIGILVDDSIVVLENIHRHMDMKKSPWKAALDGRNEIGFAALSITMVDIVVFLPLSMIIGIIGNFLRQYALVVVFTTLMSLIVSFTVTPLLASRFTKIKHLSDKSLMGRFGIWFEKLFKRITQLYLHAVRWSLRNGWKVVLASTILFIMSLMLFPFGFIGSEFIPVVDRSELLATIELEPGASFANTNQLTNKVERMLFDKFPQIDKIMVNVGASSEGFIGMYQNNAAELDITLVDKKFRDKASDLIAEDMKREIMKIPGLKVRVSPIGLFGVANRSPIQILVNHPSIDSAMVAAKKVAELVKSIDGTTDVRLSTEEGKPELRIDIDRKKMSQFGLTIGEIGANLRIALTGDNESKFREGANEFDIRVQLDNFDRSDIDNLGRFTFMNMKGQQIELKQFASVYQTTGPTKLERENRISAVNVFSQIYGSTSGSVRTAIEKKLKTLKLPVGTVTGFTGEQKFMMEAFLSLFIALLTGILFVYLIMVALYNSYMYPFVVLFSIPLAMVGAFLALALSMKAININSILGIIMLVGLVSKNAILLVDRTNQMRTERGLSTFDALVEAGETRLRPILMTTFAMIMGMMPIALSKSAGSESKSALAVVLIGGLTSSLFLTLVLVPVVYQWFDKWKVKLSGYIHKNKDKELKAEGF
ncbi:MAG: acriflavin resistance protein [Ignavibacteria bacterium]|nr:acriflavin resistance protein [Ignavibacteria bacterium]